LIKTQLASETFASLRN